MLTEPALASILADAELAYLAVETPRGPLVTPLLFTASDDRIWMVMPRSSAKVAAIGRNPFVGLAAGRPDSMVVLQGTAHLVDPLRPQSLLSSLPETLRSPRAMGSYVANNVAHLAGLIGPGVLAPRTVAAMRPQRAMTVRGDHPLWSAGTWPDAPRPGAGRPDPPELHVVQDVPTAIRRLTTATSPVVVGWCNPEGPVAIPGFWDPERQIVSVPGEIFERTGCYPASPACALFDATEGTSLDGKAGLVLRGHGTATLAADGVELALATDRISWWQGDRSRTVMAS